MVSIASPIGRGGKGARRDGGSVATQRGLPGDVQGPFPLTIRVGIASGIALVRQRRPPRHGVQQLIRTNVNILVPSRTGGFPLDQVSRDHERLTGLRLRSLVDGQQVVHGHLTHLSEGGRDGRERGGDQSGGEDVVEADHADVAGNIETGRDQGPDQSDRNLVVISEHRGGWVPPEFLHCELFRGELTPRDVRREGTDSLGGEVHFRCHRTQRAPSGAIGP